MRSLFKYSVVAFALVALTIPAWARKDETTLDLDHAVTIGTTQLQAGEYQLRADEDKSDLVIMKDGKMVVDAQGHWVKLAKKIDDTQVLYNADHLVEVDFGGTAESFHLN